MALVAGWEGADLRARFALYRALRRFDEDRGERADVAAVIARCHAELVDAVTAAATAASSAGRHATAAGLYLVLADLVGEPEDAVRVSADRAMAESPEDPSLAARSRARLALARLLVDVMPPVSPAMPAREATLLRQALEITTREAPLATQAKLRLHPEAARSDSALTLEIGPVALTEPFTATIEWGETRARGRVATGQTGATGRHEAWMARAEALKAEVYSLDAEIERLGNIAGMATASTARTERGLVSVDVDTNSRVTSTWQGGSSSTYVTNAARDAVWRLRQVRAEREAAIQRVSEHLAAEPPEDRIQTIYSVQDYTTGLHTQVWSGTLMRQVRVGGPAGELELELDTGGGYQFERVGPTLGPFLRNDFRTAAEVERIARADHDAFPVEELIADSVREHLLAAVRADVEARLGEDAGELTWARYFLGDVGRDPVMSPATPGVDVPPPPAERMRRLDRDAWDRTTLHVGLGTLRYAAAWGDHIVVQGEQGVRVIDRAGGPIDVGPLEAVSVRVSPDGTTLAVAGLKLRLLGADGSEVDKGWFGIDPLHLRFSADGRHLLALHDDARSFEVWDLSEEEKKQIVYVPEAEGDDPFSIDYELVGMGVAVGGRGVVLHNGDGRFRRFDLDPDGSARLVYTQAPTRIRLDSSAPAVRLDPADQGRSLRISGPVERDPRESYDLVVPLGGGPPRLGLDRQEDTLLDRPILVTAGCCTAGLEHEGDVRSLPGAPGDWSVAPDGRTLVSWEGDTVLLIER
ncbi:MAG: hypothetical protein Q8P18_31705 [Pseudomonadota bacterium]|nr:hypothetical protein [Pseudomonadota bacterium]